MDANVIGCGCDNRWWCSKCAREEVGIIDLDVYRR